MSPLNVEGQAKGGEGVDDGLNAARDLALLVGVLDAQVEHAARLVSQTLIDECAVEVAEVHEAGRAGTHAGHLGALGQRARRVLRQNVLGGLCDMRKEDFRQTIPIHVIFHLRN